MADYVTLLGSEQVQSAARQMSDAADKMNHAAYSIECSLERHRQFMDDWLQRFEAAIEPAARASKDRPPSEEPR